MFPTSLQHPYAPRGRRRGRNDPNSRDYICPCGKSYLSYPALFTHIKIKHNGRAPGQIIKPKIDSVSKRGRPRQKQVYDSESDTNDIAANCIDRLCDFVTEFQRPQKSSLLKQLYQKDSFYKIFLSFNPQQQQSTYNQREDLYQQFCDNVFCQIIAEVNKRLNQPFYVDLIIVFFMLMSHAINTQLINNNQGQMLYVAEDIHQDIPEDIDIGDKDIDDDISDKDIDEEIEENYDEEQDLGQLQKMSYQLPKISNQRQSSQLHQSQQHQLLQIQEAINQHQQLAEPQVEYDKQQANQRQIDEMAIDEQFFKLKHEPIKNIVNFVNSFILNSYPKLYQQNKLNEFEFFDLNNIKKFIEIFFNWLTMKKYICFKLKINKNY